jgi:LCP family protein required for cell wall assembly
MPDERPPSLWLGMWKRFLIAGVLITALSGAATATVALNTIGGLGSKVFNSLNRINAPKGLVTPEYGGGPETFLVLGSDRREGSKNSLERTATPHSDTLLLVRFDPSQGQTSVMSIPRDLLVDITDSHGGVWAGEKINAAYTIGSKSGGAKGGIVLAAETVVNEVFPELKGKLNGIVDVNFKGFIKVVDTLGCAYVNVDHHYYNANIGTAATDYTSINLQPGYQKLCYESALNYVRYRHEDSDFVRVARQQDFLRNLRQQISPSNEIGQIGNVAKAVGHAILQAGFNSSAGEIIELAKLIAFSQAKPLRQVKFLTSSVNAQIKGGSYVTSTPALEKKTLENFIHGHEQLVLPKPKPKPKHHSSHHHTHSTSVSSAAAARALNLYPTSSIGEGEAVKAALSVPFAMLYPTLQTGPAEQQMVRAYSLEDQQHNKHHAYVVVWRENGLGGYYDFEGSDWLNPPLFAHARTQTIDGRSYRFVNDGSHIHVIGWREGRVLYWLTNTLLEELSNQQMLALAKSAQPLR